jgi:hypothetical protein
MANQKFYESPGKRQEDDDFGKQTDWRPAANNQRERLGQASNNANQTLGNIDDVLAAEDAAVRTAPTTEPNSTEPASSRQDDPATLRNKESNAAQQEPSDTRTANENPMNYTGSGSQKNGKQNILSGNMKGPSSSLKKKIMIAGAATGGATIGGVLVFMALLPLKIENIIKNVDARFAAASSQAISTEGQNLLSSWVTKEVLPNLSKGTCHTTVSAGCVSVAQGNTPVSKLYNGWRDGKLEQKLATKGIVIGKTGNNYFVSYPDFTMTTTPDQIEKLKNGKLSIFDIGSSDRVAQNRSQIRKIVKNAFSDGTLWERTYVRFKMGGLAERKYGVKRCVIACNARDKFTDSINDKKLAAKAYFIQHVVGHFSESGAFIAGCVINGLTGACDPTTGLEPAQPGDTERSSTVQKQIETKLAAYAATIGSDELKDLVKKAQLLADKGLTTLIARTIASKIASSLGGEAAGVAAANTAEKVISPAGWVILAGQVINAAGKLGPFLQYAGYAAAASSAVAMYQMYSTVVSETHSGHMNAAELGSFARSLSTNTDETSSDQWDATQAPLYSRYVAGTTPTTASIFSSLFGAASADATSKAYTCQDGSPRKGPVCPEENFIAGSETADTISNVVNAIPGLSAVAGAIATVGQGINWVLEHTPVVSTVLDWLGSAVNSVFHLSDLVNALMNQMINDPFAKTDGVRNFDMIVAGDDVLQNASCRVNLGCPSITNEQAALIQNEAVAEQKANFTSLPLFARIFSTNTPYSLLSRFATSMPTSLLTTTNTGVASLLSNPLFKVTNSVSSIFSSNQAFAADPAQPDPFGITQTGYTAQQLDTLNGIIADNYSGDYGAYWTANCADPNNPSQMDQTKFAAWLNDPANVAEDPNTGEEKYLQPNYCQLIQSTVQSVGAMFSDDLAQAAAQ